MDIVLIVQCFSINQAFDADGYRISKAGSQCIFHWKLGLTMSRNPVLGLQALVVYYRSTAWAAVVRFNVALSARQQQNYGPPIMIDRQSLTHDGRLDNF